MSVKQAIELGALLITGGVVFVIDFLAFRWSRRQP